MLHYMLMGTIKNGKIVEEGNSHSGIRVNSNVYIDIYTYVCFGNSNSK